MPSKQGMDILINGNVQPFKRSIQEAKREIADLGQKGKKAVSEVEKGTDKAAGSAKKMGDAAKKAGDAYTDSMGRARDASGKFIKSADGAGKAIEGVAGKARNAKKDFEKLTLASGAMFAGLGVSIGLAVKQFGDLEATFNSFRAVTGATTGEIEQLKAQALALGTATRFSAKQAAEGMVELGKAGFTAQQTMESITGVLALAAIENVSVAQAAELAGGTLRGFNLEASEAGRVADVLAQAASQSAIGLNDLQNTMKYVAPVASAASQTLEEMSAAVAVMGNSMIRGEQAGTTIRSALVSLTRPSKEAGEVLTRLGIALSDTQGKMLPLSDIVGQLRDKTRDLTEAERNKALATVFGQEALSGMLALVNTTPAAYAAMQASMKNATGQAEEMAATMNKGVNAALEQMVGSFETLAATMGESFAPALVNVAGGATNATEALAKMPPELRTVIALVASATLTFTGAYTALGLLGSGAKVASGGIAALGLTVRSVMPWVLGLSVAIGTYVAATEHEARARANAAKKIEEEKKARMDATVKAKAQKDQLAELVKEHDALADKANLSKQQQERLAKIQETLKKEYPKLAEAIKKAGDKHWGNVEAIAAETRALDELMRKREEEARRNLAQEKMALERQRAEWQAAASTATAKAGEASQAVDLGLGGSGRTFTAGTVLQAKGAQSNADTAWRAVQAAAKRVEAAEKHLKSLQTVINPPPVDPIQRDDTHGGTGGTDSAADKAAREAFQLEKMMAEERAKQAEAGAARLNAIERGRIDRKLSLLKFEHDAGKLNLEQYLREVEKVRTQEIALQAKAVTDKLTIERGATERELEAAIAAGKVKANEAQALREKLVTIDKQIIAAEVASQEALRQVHQETNQQITIGKQQAGKELRKIEQANASEAKALAKEVAIEKLGYHDREVAAAKLAFEKQRQDAQRAYDQEIERIKAAEKAGIEGTQARAEALNLLGQKLQHIGQQEESTANRLKNAWLGTLREIKGEIESLASGPSLDKVLSFGAGFMEDPEKVEKWASGIEKGAESAKRLVDALNWSEGASGGMVSQAGSAMGALAQIGQLWPLIDEGWKRTDALNKSIRDASEAAYAFRTEIEAINASLAAGALTGGGAAEAKLQAMGRELSDLEGKMKEMLGTAGFNIFDPFGHGWTQAYQSLVGQAGDIKKEIPVQQAIVRGGNFGTAIQNIQSRKDAGLLTGEQADQERLAAAKASLEEWIRVRDESTDPQAQAQARGFIEGLIPMVRQFQKVVDGHKEAADAATEAEKAALEQVNQMIDAQKQLHVMAQQRAEAEAKIADLMKQQRDLRADLVNLDKEEEQRIRGILSEGIAQRAETETQNKTRRVGEVRDEFGARRSDVNARLAAIQRQIEQERRQAEVAAHNAAMARKASAYSGPGLAVGTTAANMSGDGSSVVWNGTSWNRAPKYHDGIDRVPGLPGQEVPAVLQAGERVLTEPQARAMDSGAGGLSVGAIHVSIDGGFDLRSSRDRREIADAIADDVSNAIGFALRRSGRF